MSEGLTISGIYKQYWLDSFKVKGRINRSSFWIPYALFLLMYLFFMFVGMAIDLSIEKYNIKILFSSILPILWYLINLFPLSSSYIRRLQDVDVKPYWAGIPIVFTFIFALFIKNILYFGALGVTLLFLFSIIFLLIAILIIGLIIAGIMIVVAVIIIGMICIIYFSIFCAKGTVGPNKFGPEPPKNLLHKL
ncbi:DUF805 domain-containing protein [Macrococcoides goetzii]|uniref:DUF805 domain-containing protein n=1 Tax=Macrococcoides goetzii TaxID=1891097 RepID=A0A2G5NTA0_9STAP|nr:DUF805 domain-containing protein [Macrococcus goetzii]RAI82896.1 DUF805 domain-containing protein [Macrococcus goetzii]